MTQELKDKGITRRSFLGAASLVGTGAFLGSRMILPERQAYAAAGKYPLASADSTIYSVCLQCHTACPIKAKVQDGILVKIDGNPYTPQNMLPHLPYRTAPEKAVRLDGKICPKGQSGIQSLYDPYRIVKVLKRNGPRGANQWKVIPFDQAVSEIVEGGQLFNHIGENRNVEGLRSIYKLKDPKLSKAMGKDAKNVASGKMKVADFKEKYRDHLDLLIDPDHPDLGPVNNQFVFQAGRIEHGRKELGKRFTNASFGSRNFFEHTTICEQSHHIAYGAVNDGYKGGKWSGGKHHMKPDTLNSEFIIYFGTSPFEANFGPPIMTGKITDGLAENRLKIAVVDPRLTKTAAKAWKWVPVKPGGDAGIAMGMARWILDNKRYDASFLSNTTKEAAKSDGELSWTTSSYLVKMEKTGPGKYLRASDIGIGDSDSFVVLVNGKPVAINGKQNVQGDLEYSGNLKGISVKTAFTLYAEEARSKSLEEWAEIGGVPATDIAELADEFTSHGKRAATELYRGPVQHTNGYYNGQAVIVLNLLIGNVDHKGGLHAGGGHWHELGDKLHFPFDMKKAHPDKISSFGHKISREGSSYEKSTLFAGYPAKRPWFPFSGNVYQEIIPSAADLYPYGVKCLWLHKGTPGFAAPAGQTALEILADTSKVPLFIADDIVLGETSMYADYVFPDTAIWERFGTPHTTPDAPTKASKVRQPVVTPLTEVVSVFGEKMHCSMEAVMLAIGEKLNLPGVGKDGFGPGLDFTRPEDFFLKLMSNLSWGDKKGQNVPEATAEEEKIFLNARKHLQPTVYSPERWKKSIGSENWRKLVYFLNRGGRFEDFDDDKSIGHDGFVRHTVKRMFSLYVEKVGTQKHSLTGQYFSGLPTYDPVADASGKVVNDSEQEYPLLLSTYKEIISGQSRTLPGNYWLSAIDPENKIVMNRSTAQKMGMKEGDMMKIVSPTNRDGNWSLPNQENVPMSGKLKLIEGIRPDVVAVSWGYGHWAYGASDITVDDAVIKGDPRRTAGLCPNAAFRVDDTLKNACMTDPIGASASFYDTRVKLVKA